MKTGFDAMGHPVPANRLNNAYEFVKEVMPDISTEKAMSIVGKAASFLERDNPYGVLGAISELNSDLGLIDLTGRYRLVATLLTD